MEERVPAPPAVRGIASEFADDLRITLLLLRAFFDMSQEELAEATRVVKRLQQVIDDLGYSWSSLRELGNLFRPDRVREPKEVVDSPESSAYQREFEEVSTAAGKVLARVILRVLHLMVQRPVLGQRVLTQALFDLDRRERGERRS